MKVVFTHLWPESNAGDYAIVLGTIQAITDASNTPPKFVGLTTFGEHSDNINGHFHNTIKLGVELRPSFTPGYKNSYCEEYSFLEKVSFSIKYLLIFSLLMLRMAHMARYFLSNRDKETLKIIAEADLVIVKGGAFLMGFKGISGTMYLIRNALMVMWCSKLNNNCIIAPHSFGPFYGRIQKWLLESMLKKTKVYSRENISIKTLSKLNIDSSYMPDMAFYIRPNLGKPVKVNQKNKLVAFTVRPCPTFMSKKMQSQYYKKFANVITTLIIDGYEVIFVPQVTGPDEREDDRLAIKEIMDRIKTKRGDLKHVTTAEVCTLEDKMQIYEKCICCIGTRMHSVIFSTLVSTKVIAIAYLGPKHKGIMKNIGLEDYVLDINYFSEGQLIDMFYKALIYQDTAIVDSKVKSLKDDIAHNFSSICRIHKSG